MYLCHCCLSKSSNAWSGCLFFWKTTLLKVKLNFGRSLKDFVVSASFSSVTNLPL